MQNVIYLEERKSKQDNIIYHAQIVAKNTNLIVQKMPDLVKAVAQLKILSAQLEAKVETLKELNERPKL